MILTIHEKQNGKQSFYQKKMAEACMKDLSKQTWLTEFEGAAYYRMSRNTFRRWAEQNGFRHKAMGRNIYNRAEMDQKLKRGDAS